MRPRQRRSKTLRHPLLICPPHTPTPRRTQHTTQHQRIRHMQRLHIRHRLHLLRHLRTINTSTPKPSPPLRRHRLPMPAP